MQNEYAARKLKIAQLYMKQLEQPYGGQLQSDIASFFSTASRAAREARRACV